MDFTPQQDQSLKTAMTQAAFDLMGGGYIDSYYQQAGAGFVLVAKWWAADVVKTLPTHVTSDTDLRKQLDEANQLLRRSREALIHQLIGNDALLNEISSHLR